MALPRSACALLALCLPLFLCCGRIGFDYQGAVGDGDDGGSGSDDAGDGAVATADLVAWYPLDEVPGNRILDATGNGHDGGCTNCPMMVDGKFGSAYYFNDGPLIDIPFLATLDPSAGFTASIWFRLDDTPLGVTRCMLGKIYGVGDRNAWQLCMRDDSKPYGCWTDDTTNNCHVAGARLDPDLWHHFAMTFDGTTAKLFVNGLKVQEADNQILRDDGDLTIGGDRNDGDPSDLFIGTLDDARIWKRALTQAEITALSAL